MSRNQHHTAHIGGHIRLTYALHSQMQSINHRVARYNYFIGANAFGKQVTPALLRRCEMPGGNPRCDLPIDFLRPRTINIMCAQSRLYMSYRDLGIIGSEGGSHRGGGISMHQNDVGLSLIQYVAHSCQYTCGYIVQRLPRHHDVQIIIRGDAEEMQHTIKHFAMLPRDANQGLEASGQCLQGKNERCHLDSLRACAKYQQYFFLQFHRFLQTIHLI